MPLKPLRALMSFIVSYTFFTNFEAFKRVMTKINSLSSLLVILLFISCTPEHCFEGTESYFKASFYDYATQKEMAPDSVTVYGLQMDTSKIYDRYVRLQPAYFPLNPLTDSLGFAITINGIGDTIMVFYSSYYHFVSKECGFTYYHDLTSDSVKYTTNGIDSIKILKRTIRTTNEENIRIFY